MPLLSTLIAATGLITCWYGALAEAARVIAVPQPLEGQS